MNVCMLVFNFLKPWDVTGTYVHVTQIPQHLAR
jgi:hypothetical protein